MQSIVQNGARLALSPPVPVLATGRLVLRPFHPLDALPLWMLLADGRIASSALDQTEVTGTAAAARVAGEYNFAITLRYVGTLIGAVALHPDGHEDKLGYWLGVAWWGRGYGSEASRAVSAWAFDELQLDRLDATHLADNRRSQRVLEKLGMRHVASLARAHPKSSIERYEHYAVTRAEWLAARA